MIAGAGAGDVEAMALGVVDIFEIGVAADRLDLLLYRHEHIVDCVRNGEKPLTDIRDAINSMALVAQLEGAEGGG